MYLKQKTMKDLKNILDGARAFEEESKQRSVQTEYDYWHGYRVALEQVLGILIEKE